MAMQMDDMAFNSLRMTSPAHFSGKAPATTTLRKSLANANAKAYGGCTGNPALAIQQTPTRDAPVLLPTRAPSAHRGRPLEEAEARAKLRGLKLPELTRLCDLLRLQVYGQPDPFGFLPAEVMIDAIASRSLDQDVAERVRDAVAIAEIMPVFNEADPQQLRRLFDAARIPRRGLVRKRDLLARIQRALEGVGRCEELVGILKTLGPPLFKPGEQVVCRDGGHGTWFSGVVVSQCPLRIKTPHTAAHEFDEVSYPHQTQATQLKLTFRAGDKNSDGSLCQDELSRLVRATGANLSEDKLQELFRAVDSDNSGTVDVEEFVGWLCGEGQNSSGRLSPHLALAAKRILDCRLFSDGRRRPSKNTEDDTTQKASKKPTAASRGLGLAAGGAAILGGASRPGTGELPGTSPRPASSPNPLLQGTAASATTPLMGRAVKSHEDTELVEFEVALPAVPNDGRDVAEEELGVQHGGGIDGTTLRVSAINCGRVGAWNAAQDKGDFLLLPSDRLIGVNGAGGDAMRLLMELDVTGAGALSLTVQRLKVKHSRRGSATETMLVHTLDGRWGTWGPDGQWQLVAQFAKATTTSAVLVLRGGEIAEIVDIFGGGGTSVDLHMRSEYCAGVLGASGNNLRATLRIGSAKANDFATPTSQLHWTRGLQDIWVKEPHGGGEPKRSVPPSCPGHEARTVSFEDAMRYGDTMMPPIDVEQMLGSLKLTDVLHSREEPLAGLLWCPSCKRRGRREDAAWAWLAARPKTSPP